MSYTNKELVKRHVNLQSVPSGKKRSYSVILTENDWADLPGVSLVEKSVAVKTIWGNQPVSENVVLSESEVSLANNNLVQGSVVAASDSSLGTIYSEFSDYAVDYESGTIRRLEGGDIESGSTLIVWYFNYASYIEDIDFQVDYGKGQLRRLVGGGITDRSEVFVDFELSENQLNETAVEEAVSEANAVIGSRLDPSGRYGADATLQTGATFLAVSFVCRMAAAGILPGLKINSSAITGWLALAESYRADFESIIKDFRARPSRLSPPTHS